MERKKKLRIVQLVLFFFGLVLLLFMYFNTEKNSNVEIIPKKKQSEIKKQLDNADPKEKPYILELYLMGMFDKIYRQQTEELEGMLPKE